MSPRPSKYLDTSDCPDWMLKNGHLIWLQLDMPDNLVKVTRCDKNSRPDLNGEFWKIG